MQNSQYIIKSYLACGLTIYLSPFYDTLSD
nr:MAG TPA: hypothetical protein [Caudoviricetes sp.]